MDTLTAMAVFRRVVEAGSFSAVSREMGLSQPTVSKHVASLEQRLGTKLLNRSTRQIHLSETGHEYYDRCIQILDELAEAETSVGRGQSLPTGTIRVNTPIVFGQMHVVPHLWKFLAQYPDLKIDLAMEDRFVDLVKEGIDVAIRVGQLKDSTLIAQKLGDIPRVTVASPDYLAAHGEPGKLTDLKLHECLVYTLLTTRNEWHFISKQGEEKVRVKGRFCANNPDAIRQAVLNHQGVAVVPLWLINNEYKQGQLKSILNQYKPTPLEVHAIYPERRFVPQKVRCFIDYLKTSLQLPE